MIASLLKGIIRKKCAFNHKIQRGLGQKIMCALAMTIFHPLPLEKLGAWVLLFTSTTATANA